VKERDRRVVAVLHKFDNFRLLTAVTVRPGLEDVPNSRSGVESRKSLGIHTLASFSPSNEISSQEMR
jgi:hypothetical protein